MPYPRHLVVCCLLILMATPLWAQTYTVDTLADNTTLDGACTLREAVEALNGTATADCPAGGGGPEIVFSVAGTIVLGGTELTIANNVTVTGGGAITVDANDQSRVFYVETAAVVTMTGLTLTNGRTADGMDAPNPNTSAEPGEPGGCILNEGTLHLQSVTVDGCRTGDGGAGFIDQGFAGKGGKGGGIYTTGTLTLHQSNVQNNSSGNGGDGSELAEAGGDGGGIYNTGTLNITESLIEMNSAGDGGTIGKGNGVPGGNGGGIYNTGILTLTLSTIRANMGGLGGPCGASAFGGNGGYGGGLYNTETAIITETTVDQNHGGNGSVIGCEDGSTGGDGGGIYNRKSLTLTRSAITNNEGGDGTSGGFFGLPGGQGGGIHSLSSVATLNMTNVTVSGNKSGEGGTGFSGGSSLGGGLFIVGGTAQINNSTIVNNQTQSANTRRGGGIYSGSSATVTLYSTLVANNTSPDGPDLFGDFQTDGFNLIGDANDFTGLTDGLNNDQVGVADAGLESLDDNGGSTQTHALAVNSPAYDAGDCTSSGITEDQRGLIRPIDDPGSPDAGDGCDVGAYEDQSVGLALGLRLMLHGPYLEGASATGRMSNELYPAGLLPATQPYGDPLFDGTALDYDGTETPTGFVTSETDWVLVELRTGLGPETTAARQAALLRFGGSVYNMAGENTLYFPGVPDGAYYLVVRHRNHLPVMTALPLLLSESRVFHSFVDAMTSAFGVNPMIEVEPGIHALWSGDGNADGSITSFDFLNVWLPANGSAGYLQADFNLSGDVTAFDFLQHWLVSNGQASQVPE